MKTRADYPIIFYDVDTQNDFMVDPDIHQAATALYIPGAEHIRKNLAKLTEHARKKKYPIMGSVDKHAEGDVELEKNGGPFPEHCMHDSWGQKKIPETMPKNPRFIPNKAGCLERALMAEGEEVFFEKQHYNVFTNPNAKPLLNNVGHAVIYGVATDYCIKAAVLGMRELDIEVYVVTDAIKGITQEGEEKALKEMEKAGARLMTTEDILTDKVLEHFRACEAIIQ